MPAVPAEHYSVPTQPGARIRLVAVAVAVAVRFVNNLQQTTAAGTERPDKIITRLLQ